MACRVCQHCRDPVGYNESLTFREGYSYHERCHKCYVCSETNLHNAEIFKGVIFCSSCSQRIFQGCSTARKTKNNIRRNKDKSQRRPSHRTKDRRVDRRHGTDGILQMTNQALSDSSNVSSDLQLRINKRKSSTDQTITLQVMNEVGNFQTTNRLKKSSFEIGMTTDVTQELLKQMNCPVITEYRRSPLPTKTNTKTKERKKKKSVCSDLRIAELGASTEIANMALRHKSEQPVIIKSRTRLETKGSLVTSILNQEFDVSSTHEDWIDSAFCSLHESTGTNWMDRRLGSIIKLPYKTFKRNILNKSSLISALMSSDNDFTIRKKIKRLFCEEITDHQRRGLKKLYSTINRNKIPNKLGWLHLVANSCSQRSIQRSNHHKHSMARCKHFRESHSYRCMRAQAMKLAGPTASELAGFRNKMVNVFPGFIRGIGAINRKPGAVMITQACGNSIAETSK